jgi:hypothetical protein
MSRKAITDEEFEKLKSDLKIALENAPKLIPDLDYKNISMTSEQATSLFPFICITEHPFMSKLHYFFGCLNQCVYQTQ